MELDTLMAEINATGLSFSVNNGNIYLFPSQFVTPEIRSSVKALKKELINFAEEYEERAAIMQYDAKLTREVAEERAYSDCIVQQDYNKIEEEGV